MLRHLAKFQVLTTILTFWTFSGCLLGGFSTIDSLAITFGEAVIVLIALGDMCKESQEGANETLIPVAICATLASVMWAVIVSSAPNNPRIVSSIVAAVILAFLVYMAGIVCRDVLELKGRFGKVLWYLCIQTMACTAILLNHPMFTT